MAHRPLRTVLRHIRELVGHGAPAPDADGPLLRRFCEQADEDAFAALVRRHGSMVLGVCRRVLGDAHASEDAFQATFLVLQRRAAALSQSATLTNWLYTVAYRIALRARMKAARRRAGEMEAAHRSPGEATDPNAPRDLRDLLDEEPNRLPQCYRAPLVLCYLEGNTNEAAARLLGWTRRSVTGRLARARVLLHGRLTRRGLTLPVGGIAALAEVETVSAAVVDRAVRAATLFALGDVVAVPVAALTHETLRAMLMEKIMTFAGLLAAGLILTGTGLLALQAGSFGAAGGDEAANVRGTTAAADTDRAADPNKPAADELRPLNNDNHIGLQFHEATQRSGVLMLRKGMLPPNDLKVLTRCERKATNNTALRLDGNDYLLGTELAGVSWATVDGRVQKARS